MSNQLTLPLKTFGGKFHLAPKLLQFIPSHLHYVEPYAGGMALLFAKPFDNVSEVVNDLNKDLINFWMILQKEETFNEFNRLVSLTPFSEYHWQEAKKDNSLSPVERAVNYFIVCRQSLAGMMKNFATLSKTRLRNKMNEQVSAWLNAVDGLPVVYERLKRVVILNRPALKVILDQDSPKTFFYLDPPYLPETRIATNVYKHEMTRDDHRTLLELLTNVQGKFMLSGYDNELYNEFEGKYKWTSKTFNLPNNTAKGINKRRMIEKIWMNY